MSAIVKHVRDHLVEQGFEIEEKEAEGLSSPIAHAEWTLTINGSEINPAFSMVSTAARVIGLKLAKALGQEEDGSFILQARTINDYKNRRVGWHVAAVRS